MKLRIKGNSIRLRLTRSEVSQFLKENNYSETTDFGQQILKYSLIASESTSDLDVSFENNHIRVIIPFSQKMEWAADDKVGFTFTKEISKGKTIIIKVEKDFVCLDETEEDQSDNYPNPRNT